MNEDLPQSEIDRISASRAMHDAELLQNGALYKDGVLQLSELEVARLKRDAASNSGRVLVLHSESEAADLDMLNKGLRGDLAMSEEELLEKEVDDQLRADSNYQALLETIENVTSQYRGIFDERIPATRDNKRTFLGNRLVEDTQYVPTWFTTIRGRDGSKIDYGTSVSYTPGEKYNLIAEADVRIFGETLGCTGDLHLEYEKGVLGTIEFTSQNPKELNTSPLSVNLGLEAFIATISESKVLPNMMVRVHKGSATFVIEDAGRRVVYAFNPESGSFELSENKLHRTRAPRTREESKTPIGLLPWRDIPTCIENVPDSVSIQQFGEVVDGLLGLLPIIEK